MHPPSNFKLLNFTYSSLAERKTDSNFLEGLIVLVGVLVFPLSRAEHR